MKNFSASQISRFFASMYCIVLLGESDIHPSRLACFPSLIPMMMKLDTCTDKFSDRKGYILLVKFVCFYVDFDMLQVCQGSTPALFVSNINYLY